MSDLFKDLEKSGAVMIPTQDEQHNHTVPSVYRGVAPKGDNIFTSAIKAVGNMAGSVAKDATNTLVVRPAERLAQATAGVIGKGAEIIGDATNSPNLSAYGSRVINNVHNNDFVNDSSGKLLDQVGVNTGNNNAIQTGGTGVGQAAGEGLQSLSYLTVPELGAGKTVLGATAKGVATGTIGGATHGAGTALANPDTQTAGDILGQATTEGVIGAIGGGFLSGGLKVGSNLLTKRAESQAALKLINSKSLLQKESDAVSSHINEVLSPESVNQFAKEKFNFETPEFLRDSKGNLDSAVFDELKDTVASQVNSDIPFKGAKGIFENALKGKPMTEEALKSAYLSTVDHYRILDPKTSLYKVQGGKVITDNTAKELIQNNIPVSDIQILKSMNPSEKAIAKKMLDLADSKITNPLSEGRVTTPIAEDLIHTYDNYVVNPGKKVGETLGTMRDNMKGVKIEVAPIEDAYTNMLKELEIAKNPKTGELLFGNSRVRSSPKLVDVIMKVDNEIKTLNSAKTAKNADVIAENLRQIVQDEPSVQGTYAQKLIGKIKTGIDEAIDVPINGYKQAKMDFAKNREIQDEMESIFGRAFDTSDVNRGAELVRRLDSNASVRLQNVVDRIQAEAEKRGYSGANLKGLTQVAATIERMIGAVPHNSAEGIGQSAVKMGLDAVTGNKLGVVKSVLDKMSKTKALEPSDYVRMFREILN